MLALYIILGIILFVIIVLHIPVVASVDFANENLDFKVKFLFFTIYPLKEKKPKKMSKRKKKKLKKKLEKEKQAYKKSLEKAKQQGNPKVEKQQTDKKVEQEKKPAEKKQEEKLKDKFNKIKAKWEKIKPYIPLGLKVFKKIIKAIKIRQLEVNIAVCDEDAYECAMKYGKISGAVYNALALIKQFFTVSIKHIQIDCKFNQPKSEYKVSGKVKVRPSTIIAIAVFILVNYIHINVKLKHNKK